MTRLGNIVADALETVRYRWVFLAASALVHLLMAMVLAVFLSSLLAAVLEA